MTYKTVFDVAHQGFPLFTFPAFGLVFVFIGGMLVWKGKILQEIVPNRSSFDPRSLGMIFLLFAIFWMLIGYSGILGSRGQGTAELRDPNVQMVEGTVENFVPMPWEGHRIESFDVGGHHFSYADANITPGFHNTASHGGPIKGELHVRLTYLGNDILRIEVAE